MTDKAEKKMTKRQEDKFTWNQGDVTISFPSKQAYDKAMENRRKKELGDSK